MVSPTTQAHISDDTTSSITLSPEVLASFNCPISYEPMNDPVICADGQTYNRSSIETWFSGGNVTSPLTGAPLPHLELIPNIVLRNIIQSHFPSLSLSSTSLSASAPSPPSSPISSYLQHPMSNDNSSNNWLHPNRIPTRYVRRVNMLAERRDRLNNINYDPFRERLLQQQEREERRERLNNINNNIDNERDLSDNIVNHVNEIANLINNNHLAHDNSNNRIDTTNRIMNHLHIIIDNCNYSDEYINPLIPSLDWSADDGPPLSTIMPGV